MTVSFKPGETLVIDQELTHLNSQVDCYNLLLKLMMNISRVTPYQVWIQSRYLLVSHSIPYHPSQIELGVLKKLTTLQPSGTTPP